MALRLADRWAGTERAARAGLRAGNSFAGVLDAPLHGATEALRAAVGEEVVPAWLPNMPRPAPAGLPRTRREGAAAVYFPACINRIFGHARGERRRMSLPAALVAVSERAGRPVWIPEDAAGHCCATPWHSKGFREGSALMANRMVERLWRWSGEGALPVVVDASSCSLGLAHEVGPHLTEENRERHAGLRIVDSIAWAHDELLPHLQVKRRVSSAVVHPVCATHHLGLAGQLEALAGRLAESVTVPVEATCCGFAGDRGFLHPELTDAATAVEAAEVRATPADVHLCSNRTCEIGLQRATGEVYTSFVYLLEELTR